MYEPNLSEKTYFGQLLNVSRALLEHTTVSASFSHSLDYWPQEKFALNVASWSGGEFKLDPDALAESFFDFGNPTSDQVALSRRQFVAASRRLSQAARTVSAAIAIGTRDSKGAPFKAHYPSSLSSVLRMLNTTLHAPSSMGIDATSSHSVVASEVVGFFISLEQYVIRLVSKRHSQLRTLRNYESGPLSPTELPHRETDRNTNADFFGRYYDVQLFNVGGEGKSGRYRPPVSNAELLWDFDIAWTDWGTNFRINAADLHKILLQFRSSGVQQAWFQPNVTVAPQVNLLIGGTPFIGVPMFDCDLSKDDSTAAGATATVRVDAIRGFKGLIFFPRRVMGGINHFHSFFGFLPWTEDITRKELQFLQRSPWISEKILARSVFFESTSEAIAMPYSDPAEIAITEGLDQLSRAQACVLEASPVGFSSKGVLIATFVFSEALRQFTYRAGLHFSDEKQYRQFSRDLLDYLQELLYPELRVLSTEGPDFPKILAEVFKFTRGNSSFPQRHAIQTMHKYIDAVAMFLINIGNLNVMSPVGYTIPQNVLMSRHSLESVTLTQLIAAQRVASSEELSALRDLLPDRQAKKSRTIEHLDFLLSLQSFSSDFSALSSHEIRERLRLAKFDESFDEPFKSAKTVRDQFELFLPLFSRFALSPSK